jgi:hypothetical protein
MSNKVGRPSKYDEIDLDQVKKLAVKGWTDKEMSEFFEVDERTWARWKAKYDEFCHALKDWKQFADERVERSLYERAIGYTCKDTKFATFEGQICDEREYDKHHPPDPTSMIFWLKNRDPKRWRANGIDPDEKDGLDENDKITVTMTQQQAMELYGKLSNAD